MNTEDSQPFYSYLRSHVDAGRTEFVLTARSKSHSDGVEFHISPAYEMGNIGKPRTVPFSSLIEHGARFESCSDPENPEFDFLFNALAVPEPDVEKFKLLMKRLNMRDGLDEHGKEIQDPMD